MTQQKPPIEKVCHGCPDRFEGCVRLSDDQSLPEIKHETYTDAKEQLARDHYEAGWNNGVNNAFRSNFRRITPK